MRWLCELPRLVDVEGVVRVLERSKPADHESNQTGDDFDQSVVLPAPLQPARPMMRIPHHSKRRAVARPDGSQSPGQLAGLSAAHFSANVRGSLTSGHGYRIWLSLPRVPFAIPPLLMRVARVSAPGNPLTSTAHFAARNHPPTSAAPPGAEGCPRCGGDNKPHADSPAVTGGNTQATARQEHRKRR